MKDSSECIGCKLTANHTNGLVEAQYWRVDLSDNQAYLGRSIVSLRRHAESLRELSDEEWLELKEIINRLETALKNEFQATAFNWTALMNDAYKSPLPRPHLHLHLWPRYRNAPVVDGEAFKDPNFAHHYDKTAQHLVADEIRKAISDKIAQAVKLEA